MQSISKLSKSAPLLKRDKRQPGFTLVELLIVIVIIAILAAVTIIAYNGITQKARTAVLQSDLSSGRTVLGIYNSSSGEYPVDQSSTELKASNGDTLTYARNGDGYCLQASGWDQTYYVTDSISTPTSGSCPATGTLVMQTVTITNCPSTRTMAKDARDNHTYWIQKLADGNCWMLTNLAYGGGGTATYSDTRSLTLSDNVDTNADYAIPSGSNVTTDPTSPSTATNGAGQYGYVYNFCAANGGQQGNGACDSTQIGGINTAISVCPAGWRLPIADDDSTNEFDNLISAVNGGSYSTDAGLLTTWLGQYLTDNNNPGDGTEGDYWASNQRDPGDAYALTIDSTEALPDRIIYNGYQLYVRCVAD